MKSHSNIGASLTEYGVGANTVKLGDKERFDKEKIGVKEPFPVTNLPVYFINSEQPGVSEQFCDGQKVPYH